MKDIKKAYLILEDDLGRVVEDIEVEVLTVNRVGGKGLRKFIVDEIEGDKKLKDRLKEMGSILERQEEDIEKI